MTKIFSEPFNLDEVDRVVRDRNFLHVAFYVIGTEAGWRNALDQIARLIAAFDKAGRPADAAYVLAAMLLRRTGQLCNPAVLHLEATQKLGVLSGVMR